jgi:hypothetical protein
VWQLAFGAGLKSLKPPLRSTVTLVIGRLKTVVDLVSGLSKRRHGRSEPKGPLTTLTHDCRGLSLSPH